SGQRDTRSMPKKVKLVDLFSGPVYLNANGEADIALAIPDFNGTLRLMAVAATDEGFGHADREMTVSAPIVAEIAMPRFIGPGDSAALALDVTNMMDGEREITIKLATDRLLRLADGERTVKLKPRQRSILRFNVEATEPYGLSRVTLDVGSAGTGAGSKAVKIHREFALQVQPPVAREADTRRVRIEPGASVTLDTKIIERFHRASSTVSMTLSNKPPINVNSIVKGLLDYPYGCLEQTTSAAYPHVFIDEAGAKLVGLVPHTREQRAKFIEGAISRIAGMQGAGGGYHLWSSSSGSDEGWLTPYVTGFLMDARDAGFNVPEAMNKRAQTWMVERLNNTANQFAELPTPGKPDANGKLNYANYDALRVSHQRFAELAHIGYMLARDQKASLASLRLLHDKYRERARSPLPLVHLGIALALMGDAKRSKVAIDEAMTRPYGIRQEYEWDWLGDYGSKIRDQALSYALLTRHKIEHPQREPLLVSVADAMTRERWYYSTQERIALFLAARAAGGATAEGWKAQYKLGEAAQTLASKTSETRALDPAEALKGVTVENTGTAPLWVDIEASGFPSKPTPPSAEQEQISVTRQWFTTDGKPWKGGTLKTGDMLLVRLNASAKQVIEDALVVDHIPAGLEVENLNLSAGPKAGEFLVDGANVEQAIEAAALKHSEYRDDRYVAALRLDGTTKHLFYMLRVVTPGRFNVPGTFAEDMYRPNIRTHGAAPEPVTVVDPRAAK
ncbi:MAG: alpha-2-macroglobulin family protein, partial [Gammaproteobacteria bacterium]